MAAKLGFYEICNCLLRAGADPNICDFNNKSALFYSVEHNDIETVQILIENGASCNIIDDVCDAIYLSLKKHALTMHSKIVSYKYSKYCLKMVVGLRITPNVKI